MMKWFRYECPNCGQKDSNLDERKNLEVHCSNCDSDIKLLKIKEYVI